jgi:hypothetical protein
MVLHMVSQATRSLITSTGMVTSSKIFFFSKTNTKTFLTLTVTSIKWGKMAFREATQKYMQQLGFMASTSQFTHRITSILMASSSSRQMARRALMIILV